MSWRSRIKRSFADVAIRGGKEGEDLEGDGVDDEEEEGREDDEKDDTMGLKEHDVKRRFCLFSGQVTLSSDCDFVIELSSDDSVCFQVK